MTSSNKARRYLQHHKQHSTESNNNDNQQSSGQLLVVDTTLSMNLMRKFRGKSHQQSSPSTTVSIPQICVNNNDDDNGHVDILNEFDQVLENELRRTSVLRTLSLKQSESTGHISIPINQQRSFSFALGSKTNLDGKKHDDDNDDDENETIHPLPSKTIKLPATSKSSLSKEAFSRLFHSLTFRSGSHSTSKIDSQHPCLACQNYPNLDIIPKTKKRPSIFGVLVSKLNSSSNIDNTSIRCTVCKRILSKTVSTNNDDNQQLSSSKYLRDQKQLFTHTKRRQSLPSLIQNLLEPSSIQHRPSFSSILIDHQQLSKLSQSSSSLTESDDSYDNPSQLNEKAENENELTLDNSESHDLNSMNSYDSTAENNTNQQFLHPPEEKTRSLLTNVFRTRRSNVGLNSNEETNMVGKQFSVSVLNLTTSTGPNRRNSAIATINESIFDHKKHALSDENLPSMDNTFIYFTNINGENFKEKLKYSTISENTTLREMLIKIFDKHNLSIETYHTSLRSAPNLPLSLEQPIKHLLLDDLVVTGIENMII